MPPRLYNPVADARWSSEVASKAKDFVPALLQRSGGTARTDEINEAFRIQYPNLCDDSVWEAENKHSPKWKQSIANALQGLKTKGIIRHSAHEVWALSSAVVSQAGPAPPPSQPPTGHPPMVETPPPSSPPPPGPDLHQRLLERLQSLKPTQFENLVGKFLKAKGLVVLRSRGGPGDEGVDGECEIPFLKLRVAFQAKRYAPANNVGIEPVQRLRGSMSSGFDRGVFITTSSFTTAARGWVEETRSPITLVDGNELVTEMVEMGLGMTTIPVVETQIDEEFFNALGS